MAVGGDVDEAERLSVLRVFFFIFFFVANESLRRAAAAASCCGILCANHNLQLSSLKNLFFAVISASKFATATVANGPSFSEAAAATVAGREIETDETAAKHLKTF